MSARTRFAVWTAAVALLIGGQLAWLFCLRGPRVLASDEILIGGQVALALPLLLIALLLTTTPADAIKLRRRTSEWIILGGVAVLQLAAVVLLRPALSEDVLRYRTDGRMWLNGVSPYATAPLEWPGRDAIDALVPFPHMRTIYPAVSQATFVAIAAIEGALMPAADASPAIASDGQSPWRAYLKSHPTPYRATVFRAIYALAAVAMTWVMLLLLRGGQGGGGGERSAWWAVVVAWNPLVTLEIGGMGHQDVVGVLLMLLCLYAATKARPVASMTWLALAAAVKPFAFCLAPFVLRDFGGRRGRAAMAFAAMLAILYLPPLFFQNGYAGWRDSARTYSQTWEANGSIYELVTRTFGDGDEGRARERAKQMARLLGAATLLAVGLAAWRFRAAPATAGYWLCLAALLVSPVVYPWYLLWALCFVPMLDGRAGWTALVWAGTVGVSYVVWHQPTWRMSSTALLAEYGAVYAVLAVEIALVLRRARAAIAQAKDVTSDLSPSLFPPPRRGSFA
jgi:hypothetical protein